MFISNILCWYLSDVSVLALWLICFNSFVILSLFISNLVSLLVVLDDWKLFEKCLKQFEIGGALPPKRNLTRFVKWPKTVQIQRKKRILKQRLKVPPALNQFTKTLDKNVGQKLTLKFLDLVFGAICLCVIDHLGCFRYFSQIV